MCVLCAFINAAITFFCLHSLFHLRYAKMAAMTTSLNVTSIRHVLCFYLSQKTSNVSLTALEKSPESVSVLSYIALQSDIIIQMRVDIN